MSSVVGLEVRMLEPLPRRHPSNRAGVHSAEVTVPAISTRLDIAVEWY